MDTFERVFAFVKETKNTVRYAEDDSGGLAEGIGTLYVQKVVAGDPAPQHVKVTVEAVE